MNPSTTAYANNQVKAHEEAIERFKKEANTVTDDKTKGATELKAFAQKMLPALEKHLGMAKKLQAAHPKEQACSRWIQERRV